MNHNNFFLKGREINEDCSQLRKNLLALSNVRDEEMVQLEINYKELSDQVVSMSQQTDRLGALTGQAARHETDLAKMVEHVQVLFDHLQPILLEQLLLPTYTVYEKSRHFTVPTLPDYELSLNIQKRTSAVTVLELSLHVGSQQGRIFGDSPLLKTIRVTVFKKCRTFV